MDDAAERPTPEFVKLLKSWGVDFDPTKVAGDIAQCPARAVRRRRAPGGDGVCGLARARSRAASTRRTCCRAASSASTLPRAGFLSKAEGATTQVTPILLTSPQAMQIAAEKFGMTPDPVGLLRAYKPEGKPLMLGGAHLGYGQQRLSRRRAQAAQEGTMRRPRRTKRPRTTKSPRPSPQRASRKRRGDGRQPKDEKAEAAAAPAKPHTASGRINAIVVADADLLDDQFWVEVRDFLGQQVAIPNASNAAFVVNALDNLSGSECADRAARPRRRGPPVQARQRAAPRRRARATARRSRR